MPADDPVVVEATEVVQRGDLGRLDALLIAHPWLTTARFGDVDCHRTLLHAATDWPGHFPNGPAVVGRLVAAGADVNARSRFSAHTETPLHWAASSDDVDVLDALLDAGADLEAPGAVLGGGPALADATGFGNLAAARRLVERGAQTRLQDAAALGMLDRLDELVDGPAPHSAEVVTHALWSACNNGQLEAAVLLADRGGDPHWMGWDELTPIAAAERAGFPEIAAALRRR